MKSAREIGLGVITALELLWGAFLGGLIAWAFWTVIGSAIKAGY